jgi:magnesium chelatase family protein
METSQNLPPFCALLNRSLIPKLQWIEVFTSLQVPGLQIVGLASREVGEAKERVRSAILASGLSFPKKRVVLNLSPAHVPKQGTGTDLSMALAILLSDSRLEKTLAWGELSLH